MTTPIRTITCMLPGRPQRSGRKPGKPRRRSIPQPSPGRIPRISRWMALALRLEQRIRQGTIGDYATLAELGHVSRARITQIMNLLLLAPDIQEALLFLPPISRGRDPFLLRQLQPLAALLDWRQQRCRWHTLQQRSYSQPHPDLTGAYHAHAP
jgi:hypothetical protein